MWQQMLSPWRVPLHNYFTQIVASGRQRADWLIWYALLHDIGKPKTQTHESQLDGTERTHFYEHEDVGAELGIERLTYLNFSRQEINRAAKIVQAHMRPHHLHSSFKNRGISRRAIYRFVRDLEGDKAAPISETLSSSVDTTLLAWADYQSIHARLIMTDWQGYLAHLSQLLNFVFEDQDADYNRGPHMDYPSFENICMSMDDDGNALLLTDQATYCLSSGHIYCPRYRATRAAPLPNDGPPVARRRYTEQAGQIPEWNDTDFDWQPDNNVNHQSGSHSGHQFKNRFDNQLDGQFYREGASWNRSQTDGLLDDAYLDEFDEEPITPIDLGGRWVWLSGGMLFLAMLLCGGMLSIYTGWDMVSQRITDQAALQQREDRPAVVEIAADDPSARQLFSEQISQQPFMIITAIPQGEGGPSSPELPQAVAQRRLPTPTARVVLITPGRPTPTPTVGIIPLGYTQTPTPTYTYTAHTYTAYIDF